ncbi:autotransporter domain-containing protein [Aquabacter sp. CN5-332]|uniref:autotransporter domain-containing protein n=1 Tax=Aquabacter sp. CN5-332 TaxID=3156608 RepID=UPI0032B40571
MARVSWGFQGVKRDVARRALVKGAAGPDLRRFCGRPRLGALLLATSALVAIAPAAQGQTAWTGQNSDNWFDNGNWTAGMPSMGVDAAINNTPTDTPVIAGLGAIANDLTLGTTSNGTLYVQGGGSLLTDVGYIGANAGVNGGLAVVGPNSLWTTRNLFVGDQGNGQLVIAFGGAVEGDNEAYVGYAGTGTGLVTVTGPNSTWTVTDLVTLGHQGIGTLEISDGGAVMFQSLMLGTEVGAEGILNITGASSTLDVSGILLEIGRQGSGTVTVSDGATVTAVTTVLAREVGSTGSLALSGGSSWTTTASVFIADAGAGELLIQSGALLDVNSLVFAVGTSGTATGTVTGVGSRIQSNGGIFVGDAGSATLTVADGASVTSGEATVASKQPSTSVVTVTGAGTSWTTDDVFTVGSRGTGTLNIKAGGTVSAATTSLGDAATGVGLVNVAGTGSRLTTMGEMTIGTFGTGALSVSAGGTVAAQSVHVAREAGSTGSITVSGAGSTLVNGSDLFIGFNGTGVMFVQAGGAVSASNGVLGAHAGSIGEATVTGSGSIWAVASDLYVGSEGTGVLTASNGSTVTVGGTTHLAAAAGSSGTLNIGAANGLAAAAPGAFTVGSVAFGAGTGTLVFNHTSDGYQFASGISGAGTIQALSGTTMLSGNSANFTGTTAVSGGTLVVSGSLGNATTGNMTIGGVGGGNLFVVAGGTVNSQNGYVGQAAGETGNVGVNGTGSAWSIAGNLAVGGQGSGSLTIASGGKVAVNGTTTIASTAGSSGTLNIGAAAGQAAAAPGALATGSLAFGPGAGTLVFNHTSDSYLFAPSISGSGVVDVVSGTTALAGNSSGFTGHTSVSSGTLLVSGSLGGTTGVLSGGTLKGNGTVGPTTLAAGGTIAPGKSIGTLTVNGALSFASGSTYAVEINPAGQSDLIVVNGSATLNGANVAVAKAPGSYLPGTQYAILTAQGGVFGSFAAPTQNLPFVELALSYDPNDVYLNVVRNQTSFPNVAVTPNQISTATAVEALGQGNAVYNAVVSQTTAAGAQQAFNSLSGEIYPSAMSVLQDESLFLRRAVLDRARVPVQAPASTPLAYATKAGTDVLEVPGTPNAFWAQGFGAWSQIDGNGNAATISGDTAGIFVGYDRAFSTGTSDWRVGFTAGYSFSSYQVDARSSSFSSDNAHVAVYGATNFGALGIRLGGAYSWADISASRSVVFPGFYNALTADTSARTGQVFGEVGYGLSFAAVNVEPFVGLAYVNVNLSDFTENGGPAALTGYGGSEGVTYSTLGARMSVPFAFGTFPTAFKGTLAWQHAFGDTTPEALFAFGPGAQPFAVSGVPIAADAALVEAGLDMAFTANISLALFYAGQLSETDTSNMVKGSFTVSF